LESIAKKFGDESIQKHYTSALNKVKAMLKGAEKDKADFIQSQIKTTYVYHEFSKYDTSKYSAINPSPNTA
jgi:hypothetical protein